MGLSSMQQRALAVVPHVTGPLSMLGSGTIVLQVLTSPIKRGIAYHRLLLGMSCCDLVTSFFYSLSTWPIPDGTPGVWAPGGNTATCTTQGFFIQLGIATPLYNASLAIYYVLVGAYRWDEQRIRSIEAYLHGIPLIVGSFTAIAGLPLQLYNNANLWCWIAPYPLNCKDSFRFGDEGNCIRGDNSWIYRWAFFYAPLWFCIIFAMVSMVVVYKVVLKQEKAVDRYQPSGIALRKQSRRVAMQSFLYILAFYTSWVFGTIKRLLQTIPATQHFNPYSITLLMAIFTPLQGFLNYLVYTRARYLKFRRENPKKPLTVALRKAAFSSVKGSSQIKRQSCEKMSAGQQETINRNKEELNASSSSAGNASAMHLPVHQETDETEAENL